MLRISAALLAGVGLLLVGGAARLAYIASNEGQDLRQRAFRQQNVTITIPALRGEILDTRGRVLAGTVRRPSIYVDPALVRDARYAAHSIAPVLGWRPERLMQLINADPESRFVWVERRVSDDLFAAFRQVVSARSLRAFGVQWESERIYPHEGLAPHVLGFVGIDTQGLAGIEFIHDERLTGTAAERTVTVDVRRRRIHSKAADFEMTRAGATIVLTIDAYIQEAAQRALTAAVEKHNAEWGCAVVLDPQSGEVLAMASVPDFNPARPLPPDFNAWTEAKRRNHWEELRNRAVTDSYEPGSIFKPFIAAAALNDELVHIDQVFAINGPAHTFGRSRVIHDTHAYDVLPLHRIVSKSSNIGMGLVGDICGNQRLHDYVCNYGFGQRTGISLPGEQPGQVHELDDWTSYSTQSIPIGQEIAVTPIQIVTAFSTFCNGGRLLKPRVVRGIIDPSGQTIWDNSAPVMVRQVLRPEVAQRFRHRALVETVLDGTGKAAALDDYQAFGKTGTAQIARADGRGYEPGAYVGSFVGGAPASHPRAVVLVSIYRPRKDGYYGGVVAAPVVKQILAATLKYMRVPSELTESEDEVVWQTCSGRS